MAFCAVRPTDGTASGFAPISWPGAEADVDALSEWYVFRDYVAIRRFLIGAPDVRTVLFEAFTRVGNIFGFDSQQVLTLVRDPDEGEPDSVFLLIHDSLAADGDSLGRLARLDREWWRYSASRAPRLNIDIE